jgi:phosphoribosylaminoimidazolecarboxamide formyltransferase / IMP cyclohydrolase
MAAVKQALLSVSDKSGIVEFARGLARFGVALISTGGTAQQLRDAGLKVTEVAEHTGAPEMLDGRVKTLHPRVHAGILARRDVPGHMKALTKAAISPLDLVVVNLYPFAATVARPECTLAEAIENIDIGGPALVRSAAKNYEHVAVVTDPADYEPLLAEMAAADGAIGIETRFRLAQKAFSHTAQYDGAVSNYLTALGAAGKRERFPGRLNLQFELGQRLRYGETRTRRRHSTAMGRPRRAASGRFASCRARSSRTTTSRTPTRRGSASRASRNRRASSSSTPIRAGRRSPPPRRKPTAMRSPRIPLRPLAASSPSTAVSRAGPRRPSRNNSSKW